MRYCHLDSLLIFSMFLIISVSVIDYIHGCPIFRRVTLTWNILSTSIVVNAIAVWVKCPGLVRRTSTKICDNGVTCSGKCPLRWRHNGRVDVSNHQPHECLLKCLYRHRSKKTSKLCVTGLSGGNSPWPVNSPHKRPVTRKIFPFDDVIMHWDTGCRGNAYPNKW